MVERFLQLDDVRTMNTPAKIADIFRRLGYNAVVQETDVRDWQLSSSNVEAVENCYLIADQEAGGLQVVLFQLNADQWLSQSVASARMRSLANSLCSRVTNFLLLGTKDYNQLMLVNPRKGFDEKHNIKVSIRKLLIDRQNPTAYDLDRLEAIANRNLSALELYRVQCEAFDVEKLTKTFYQGYKKLFDQVLLIVRENNQHEYFTDDDRLHQFCQRLLGRIMFLYFLQKKEFLAGDRSFLKNQYRLVRRDEEDHDFYDEVLEPLFFDTLNCERADFQSTWGRIPYLNGGLFDRDYGPNIQDLAGRQTPEAVVLPNSLFDPGAGNSILRFFDGYNFTVAENIAGDEDVAVDPEMLGKVFENILAAPERGQSGTFYTPRGIVQFMASEVLQRYLVDETKIAPSVINKLINYDADLPDQEFDKLLNIQQVKELKEAIAKVKILDPAVGSGAFPLGMMQVILNVRQAIARREGSKVARGSLTMSQWKRDIISHNLYGVDIKPEAIEIAKLRMWLSLVVDIPTIDNVEPLPNLDYKLMCGDSLISTIHGEYLIPDPTKTQQGLLAVTPIQIAIQPLLDLQRQYFDATSENRVILRQKILEAESNVFRVAVKDRRDFLAGKLKDLQRKVKSLKKVSKPLLKEQEELVAKIADLDKFADEVVTGKRSLTFFQYHLHFRDVFTERGGFDIVIGNPPYVRQESIKELKPALSQEYECYTGVADLYVYFYEQGLRLLKPDGYLSYISPNKWFKTNYGEKLRKYLAGNSQIYNIIDFGELPVFDAATFPMIFIAQHHSVEKQSVSFTQVKSLEAPYPDVSAIVKEQGQVLPDTAIQEENWTLTDQKTANFINKIELALTTLEQYVDGQIFRGILAGFNQAFVIDSKTKDQLIAQDAKSAEVIKPLAVGDDIRKWHIRDSDKWLIFIPWHFPLHEDNSITGYSQKAEKVFQDNYPAIYNHLLNFKSELSNRNQAETNIRYEWYALQRCAATYFKEFDKPKIVFPDIAKESRFSFDRNQIFVMNTSYIIPKYDLFLLGVLNSIMVWKYAQENFACLGDPDKGGRFRFIRQSVAKVPIPKATEKEQKAIEKLVQKCLDAKGQGVEEWEKEIDERVAHLYGLNEEDLQIIRGEK